MARPLDCRTRVRRTVLIHRAGSAEPEQRELEDRCTAGGSRADALLLAGLDPGALRLEPCPAGVVVEAAAAGVHVAGHAVPPGARRLLRPGERAVVHGVVLELPPELPAASATRMVAASLLRQASSGAAPPAGPHLLVLTGPDAGARLPLGPEQTLGRSRRARLRLTDPAASRLHARLRLGPEGATVEDLGARNGLRVNGLAVDPGARALRPGDELQLGDTALALILPSAAPRRETAVERCAGAAPTGPGTASTARAVDVRRAAAALLALSALALALAGV